jgi:hypothetical protein
MGWQVVGGILTGGFLFFYFWGVRDGGGDSPATVTGPAASDPADCQQACVAWDNARQMQCSARADEQAARDRANGLRGQVAAAIAFAATVLAAAIAATVAAASAGWPAIVFLAIAAAIAWLLFAAATAASLFLGGLLSSAEADAAAKSKVRSDWDQAVADARAQVNAKCSPAEANACLSRTAPC